MNKSLKDLFKNVETHPQEEFDWGEQEYIVRLEKALDKACCVLDDYLDCPLEVFNNSFPFCKEWDCEGNSEGCWRKWLMMEGVQ